MRHLIVGLGEVGKAVMEVLSSNPNNTVAGIDLQTPKPDGEFDVLHICFPFSRSFKKSVRSYVKLFGKKDALIIIHSTVKLGTTEKLGKNAVHSPVRGVHPNLALGIKTFVKFFGGPRYSEAAQIFSELGIPTIAYPEAKTAEAIKLMDTLQYGYMIMVEKLVHEFCSANGLDPFSVYTTANESYNEGYTKLGMPHVARPVLKHTDGAIGGHCVRQNAMITKGNVAKHFQRMHKKMFGTV